jgi:hypothetical protein
MLNNHAKLENYLYYERRFTIFMQIINHESFTFH